MKRPFCKGPALWIRKIAAWQNTKVANSIVNRIHVKILRGDDEDGYETNQGIVGMRELLREHAVKAWLGAEFSTE